MSKTKPIYYIILGIAVSILGFSIWQEYPSLNQAFGYLPYVMPSGLKIHHVYDYAGILPKQDLPRFEWYMDTIMEESDVDFRFVLVKGTGKKTIEQLALDLVKKLKIGAKTRGQRGLLLLYDAKSQRLKIEVGYGLEEFFPDSFIGYLVRQHTRTYFQSGQESLGLRWLLSLMQYRIREAILGETFDPRVLKVIANTNNLSGGAGASAKVPMLDCQKNFSKPHLSKAERNLYVAQCSPATAYTLYLKWMCQPIYDPDIDLFTSGTRSYLSSLPISPAYNNFILFQEYGKSYRIVERNNLAILYFTDTPFVSPHHFIKTDGKWRLDILAEVNNTKETVGGVYSWTYTGKNDPYTRTFADLLINIHGYIRFKGGDNRALVIRGAQNL